MGIKDLGKRELEESITNIKGIGEKTGKLFNKLGVYTVNDLLNYYPRGYELFDSPVKACELKENIICAVRLTIIGNIAKRHVRNLSIVAFEAADDTGKVKVAYFNAPYLASSLKSGTTHIFRGVVKRKGNFFSMDQPKMYKEEEYAPLIGHMRPRYSLTRGLSNNAVVKAMEKAFISAGSLKEFIPTDVLTRLKLIDYNL